MKYASVFFVLCTVLIFSSCGDKKKQTTTGGEAMSVAEFLDFYQDAALPITYTDVELNQPVKDSFSIEPKIFYSFVPDSLVRQSLKTTDKARFYAVNKFAKKDGEQYFVTQVAEGNKKYYLAAALDKQQKLIAVFPMLNNTKGNNVKQSVEVYGNFYFSRNTYKTLAGDIKVEGKDTYWLDAASKKFVLGMTDSLGDATNELINPIDTLPRAHKYAGDYKLQQFDLVSIRDSKKEGKIEFFIHIGKRDNTCGGELKGEASFKTPAVAEYNAPGDPCVLQFTFTNNSVTLSEVKGCGSRLGELECSFDGTYRKVNVSKSKTKGK